MKTRFLIILLSFAPAALTYVSAEENATLDELVDLSLYKVCNDTYTCSNETDITDIVSPEEEPELNAIFQMGWEGFLASLDDDEFVDEVIDYPIFEEDPVNGTRMLGDDGQRQLFSLCKRCRNARRYLRCLKNR